MALRAEILMIAFQESATTKNVPMGPSVLLASMMATATIDAFAATWCA